MTGARRQEPGAGASAADVRSRELVRAEIGTGAGRVLRVCALYPDLMNIYADRGNLIVLERRCSWRGIGLELCASSLGEDVDGEKHDLYYLGGGQDRDQALCAEDLVERKAASLRRAAERGALVLGVCGGYQLLGHGYEIAPGESLPGVGLLDVTTVRGAGGRLIGNVAIAPDLDGSPTPAAGWPVATDGGARHVLAGFENHGGRTRLGPDAQPLGRVLRGHGNDGRSGFEGARAGSVIGTYLHGPLLPQNVWFADWLIATALGLPPTALARLDDELELAAHRGALRAAGLQRAA